MNTFASSLPSLSSKQPVATAARMQLLQFLTRFVERDYPLLELSRCSNVPHSVRRDSFRSSFTLALCAKVPIRGNFSGEVNLYRDGRNLDRQSSGNHLLLAAREDSAHSSEN